MSDMVERSEQEAHQCAVRTAKNLPCKVPADRFSHGEWLCHLHDPRGKHQQLRQHRLKEYAQVCHEQGRLDDAPELVAPLIEDHTLALFAPPTKEQLPIIKRRLTAWRRSAFWSTQPARLAKPPQSGQTNPQPAKSESSPTDTSDARYAQ